MRITLVGPMGGGDFRVHRAGCSDVGRDLRRFYDITPWTIEASSQWEVAGQVYGPDAGTFDNWPEPYYLDEFTFLPCTRGLPVGEMPREDETE